MVKKIGFDSITKVLIYGSFFIITLTVIFPFLNLIAISLSDSKHVSELSGLAILPKGFSVDTYAALLANPKVLKGLLNSILITGIGTLVNVIFTCTTAYALSFEKLYGRKFFLIFIIITMVFEPGIIPDYLVMKYMGLLDSYWSVFLYKGINVFYLMVLVRYFEEIPPSLIGAARIDGANHMQILFKIIIPVSGPAIAMIALSYGIFHWNEYFRAMIYLSDPDKWPLQVILRQFVVESDKTAMVGLQQLSNYSKAGMIDIKSLKAGIIILTVFPLILLYPLILKFFTKGTMSGSVKE